MLFVPNVQLMQEEKMTVVRSELIERLAADYPDLDPQIVGDAVIRFFEEINGHIG